MSPVQSSGILCHKTLRCSGCATSFLACTNKSADFVLSATQISILLTLLLFFCKISDVASVANQDELDQREVALDRVYCLLPRVRPRLNLS